MNKVYDQVLKFIKTELPNINISEFSIRELIENAYDVYAMHRLVIGENFEIKVVIQETDDYVEIKIKDNGPGFAQKRKGSFFSISDITKDEKNHDELLGGFGAALSTISGIFAKSNAALSFKNRKTEGATVSIQFK